MASAEFASRNATAADEEPFAFAIPLGANCLAAAWLQGKDVRKSAMPFDWAFSSPAMICDCLADDFRSFLDVRNYIAIGRRGAGAGHTRYSGMRLPGRWKGFVFLHHDPMRKKQDHEYLHRCVQRFRQVAHSRERKLFVFCCLVDSADGLAQLREEAQNNAASEAAPTEAASQDPLLPAATETGLEVATGAPQVSTIPSEVENGRIANVEGSGEEVEAGSDEDDACANNAVCVNSWKHASKSAIAELFEALKHYGCKNFHFAAVHLCIGGASSASCAPLLKCCTSTNSSEENMVSESFALHELHLASGYGNESDPFKFFGDSGNEEAFASALLDHGPKRRSFALSDVLLDAYLPQGYRDVKLEDTRPSSLSEGTKLICRWCGLDGFTSRNRLFAHVRGTPSCAAAAAEHDERGLSALANPNVCRYVSFLVGYGARVGDVLQRLEKALVAAGLEKLSLKRIVEPHLLMYPAVGDVIFASFTSALEGDALVSGARDKLELQDSNRQLKIHGFCSLSRSRASEVQSCSQRHYAYVVPFDSLHLETDAGGANDSSSSNAVVRKDTWQRKVYKEFKEVLRSALHMLTDIRDQDICKVKPQADDDSWSFEQFKMAERISMQEKEYVVLRMSGHRIKEKQCRQFVTLAVGIQRGIFTRDTVQGLLISIVQEGQDVHVPEAPAHLMYYEGCRFDTFERKHGLLFGDGTAPWGLSTDVATSFASNVFGRPAEHLPGWRKTIQADVALADRDNKNQNFGAWLRQLEIDWASVARWRTAGIRMHTAADKEKPQSTDRKTAAGYPSNERG